MNSLIISGHLGQDPKLNHTANGDAVLNMRVAVPQRVKVGSEWKDEPLWVTVTLFGKRAEALAKFLKKGRLIEAKGELRKREYEARDGSIRTDIECFAYSCDPLGKGDGARDDAGGSQAPRKQAAGGARGAQDYEQAPLGGGDGWGDDPDDDIPF